MVEKINYHFIGFKNTFFNENHMRYYLLICSIANVFGKKIGSHFSDVYTIIVAKQYTCGLTLDKSNPHAVKIVRIIFSILYFSPQTMQSRALKQ